MAKNNWLVLLLCSWAVFALGHGAFSLIVTTNPVEIWASPDSRARIEKDMFELKFPPFYRTEQIFIKTVGLSEVRFSNFHFSFLTKKIFR